MMVMPDPSAVKVISAEELRQALSRPGTVLIDTREWDSFEEAHIAGAIIMPLSEIESRARHELPPGHTVYVYCHLDLSKIGVKQPPAKPHMSLCNITSAVPGSVGFHKALYIPYDLATLAAQGIPVTGTLHN
jgi:Rhodanese-related sulfurtransferase